MDRLPPAARIVLAVLVLSVALALPWLALPADPWAAAARTVRDEARPGDLVVLVPSARADRLPSFAGLWAVALDPADLRRIRAFPRIFVVTVGGLAVRPRGYLEESLRPLGPLSLYLLGREGDRKP